MKSTHQFDRVDMLEHGKMVHIHWKKLLNSNYFQEITQLDNKFIDVIISYQYDISTMKIYHYFHDCGKPICKKIDENGKNHYPDHAKISSQLFKKCFESELIEKLILHDMIFHNSSAQDIENFLCYYQKDKNFLCSLYMTAWAEILANSTMFGGIDSTSFKIKKKKLIQFGKKLYLYLNKN